MASKRIPHGGRSFNQSSSSSDDFNKLPKRFRQSLSAVNDCLKDAEGVVTSLVTESLCLKIDADRQFKSLMRLRYLIAKSKITMSNFVTELLHQTKH